KHTIAHTYYNRAILPVAFVMMLLMAITPLAPWRQVRDRIHLRRMDKLALASAALIVVAFIPAGVYATLGPAKSHYGPPLFVFFAAVLLSLATNVTMFVRTMRGGLANSGPWFSHIAFCLVLVGVVVTSFFGRQQAMSIPRGQSASAFGYTFTYQGMYEPPAGA